MTLSRRGDFALRVAGALGCIAGRMTPPSLLALILYWWPEFWMNWYGIAFLFGYSSCLVIKRAEETELWSPNIGWWEFMR